MTSTEIIEIEIASIRPFVSRARPRKPFERLKASIKEMGLKVPIQIRKLEKRQGRYKYELIAGEGRIQAYRELKRDLIPAIVLEVPESQIVGRFLSENLLRRKMNWQEKAKLIQEELNKIGTPTKADIEVIAQRYFITPPHVSKLYSILAKASPKVRGSLEDMTVEEAHSLTTLPARNQDIVIETMAEEGISKTEIAAVTRKAKSVAQESGELSKTALKQSLRRVGEDLDRIRKSMKPIRLHHSLGPENLKTLLSDKQFRTALDKKKINYSKFEAIV